MWVAVAMAGGEPAVEDFLRPDEDLAKHQATAADVHADTSSCQADGPCRNTLTSPAVSAAATPEVGPFTLPV